MPEMIIAPGPLRIASVIARLTAGGIGPVCRYTVEGISRETDWSVTLVSLHDPPCDTFLQGTNVRFVSLGLDGNCSRLFLNWLNANPQDGLITSDVSRIEPSFRYIPQTTRHIIQIHDSGKRYRDVAVKNASWIDGVTCVGKHIEAPLRESLDRQGFRGVLATVHNGASFPPLKPRQPHVGPLRLLFMGRLDPLKGVFDLVPILKNLRKANVEATLRIVGGENAALKREFEGNGLANLIRWEGQVPHERCYQISSVSDVLLVTTRKEAFGMVTIEAMSMGCVPIAYKIPSGSTEIIEHGKSGLLVPLGNLKSFSQTIYELDQNRSGLKELSDGAILRAREHFNSQVMARNMAAFTHRVLLNSSTNPPTRCVGLPPETSLAYQRPRHGYQFLPAGLRAYIRSAIYRHPRLSSWMLKRW